MTPMNENKDSMTVTAFTPSLKVQFEYPYRGGELLAHCGPNTDRVLSISRVADDPLLFEMLGRANAAPELYESLFELVNSPNAKQNAMWDRARAALAKVTA